MQNDTYQNPLVSRYSSPEMTYLFSSQFKYSTWRKLWKALAEVQMKLGLPINEEQIKELSENINNIDFDRASFYEKQLKHDVMAHIHAFGDQCPNAKSIIHLGATSCYVTDNTDLIQMKRGLEILQGKLEKVLRQLAKFAETHKDLACLSFTHFQPAQLTTVGKRACLWAQDFLMDIQEVNMRSLNMKFLGVKGATGTQASFLSLFNFDESKVLQLDKEIATDFGFNELFSISGQTYTRKLDAQVFNTLSGIAVSAHKFGTDIRLLAHLKEIEEPFDLKQVGSSAMPYKRNPMLSERVCSLSRFALSLNENGAYTAATQWLERSLDDSANRRISIPEMFLACDSILNLLIHITAGLVVYPKVISKHINEELPFMATENLLMAAVKEGGDRQVLHERLRVHSQETARSIKQEGKSNDLIDRLLKDPQLNLNKDKINKVLDTQNFTGLASKQVDYFINQELYPTLQRLDLEAVPTFIIEI